MKQDWCSLHKLSEGVQNVFIALFNIDSEGISTHIPVSLLNLHALPFHNRCAYCRILLGGGGNWCEFSRPVVSFLPLQYKIEVEAQ